MEQNRTLGQVPSVPLARLVFPGMSGSQLALLSTLEVEDLSREPAKAEGSSLSSRKQKADVGLSMLSAMSHPYLH